MSVLLIMAQVERTVISGQSFPTVKVLQGRLLVVRVLTHLDGLFHISVAALGKTNPTMNFRACRHSKYDGQNHTELHRRV